MATLIFPKVTRRIPRHESSSHTSTVCIERPHGGGDRCRGVLVWLRIYELAWPDP